MLVDNVRQRKTERQRRWREKKHNGSVVTYPIDTGETRNEFTFNKMSKCRAIKRLKCALPRTPVKRVATVKAYLSCKKSPTVQELQRQRVVPSPEEIKDAKLNKSVLEDLRTVISSKKREKNDKSREIIDVVTASVSGSSVNKCKARVNLANKLGLPVRRIVKGSRIRTHVLHSEESSYQYVKRKTRSDRLSEETRKTIYDFWCLPENSRQTGNKKMSGALESALRLIIVMNF